MSLFIRQLLKLKEKDSQLHSFPLVPANLWSLSRRNSEVDHLEYILIIEKVGCFVCCQSSYISLVIPSVSEEWHLFLYLLLNSCFDITEPLLLQWKSPSTVKRVCPFLFIFFYFNTTPKIKSSKWWSSPFTGIKFFLGITIFPSSKVEEVAFSTHLPYVALPIPCFDLK